MSEIEKNNETVSGIDDAVVHEASLICDEAPKQA